MMKRKSPPPATAPAAAPASAPATDASPAPPTAAALPPKKRRRATQPVGNLTNAQKRLLCVQFARAKMTQQELCHWARREFRLAHLPHQSTVSKILARAAELTALPARALPARRRGLVTHPPLDVALSNWVLFARHRRLKLSGDSIKDAARRLAAALGLESTMSFSNGWLGGFKKRHNIRLGAAAGAGATPAAGEPAPATVADLQQVAALYSPRDVFCMAEAGLLYSLAPEKPAGRSATAAKSGEATTSALPDARTRLTVVLCVNADATERLEPLFIGRGPLPGAPAAAAASAPSALPLDEAGDAPLYLENARAWVTPVLFQDWVEALDTRMRDADRRVLLLVSRGAPTHICAGLALSHVRLELLPPSVERPASPLEGDGVLAALKRRYRRYHMCHALDQHEAGRPRARVFAVDTAQAMRWTRYCWRDLPDEVVRHYWRRAGLLTDAVSGTEAGVEAGEEEIDREICDTVSALDVLRPLMIDEFISPADEDAGIHCPGADDSDLVHTVPTSMLRSAAVPGRAADSGEADAATSSSEMTPRLQALHNRSLRRPTPAAIPSTSLAPSLSTAVPTTTATAAAAPLASFSTRTEAGADGSATDEQLLSCFRVLLPELDRLRFDDRTKKSIRATYRQLKEAVEQPHAQLLHRGRGGSAALAGTRNASPSMPAVGQGGHVVYHPTQEPQQQSVIGFQSIGMPGVGTSPHFAVPPPHMMQQGGSEGASSGPGPAENAML